MAEAPNKRKRTPRYTIEISCDEDFKKSLLDKLHNVRDILTQRLQQKATTAETLDTVLDFWLQKNNENAHGHSTCRSEGISSFVPATQDTADQPFYICAQESLQKLVQIADNHGRSCKQALETKKVTYSGHVGILRLACQAKTGHKYLWSSSPYLPNKKHLVNERLQHSFGCSGMLPSHYKRFSQGAGIGFIDKEKRRDFYNTHKESIEKVYNDSIDNAIMHEIGFYEFTDADTFSGIEIITDARHGWRKNSKDSSVSAIGVKSGKILHHEHITTAQLPASQSHEKLGTEHIYKHFEEKCIPIAVHVHDRNASINKYVREHQGPTINQNDRWHAIKAVKKKLTEISTGPQYKHGKTWHMQLNDKVESVGNHFYWAIANCEGNTTNLKMKLDNIVLHYQNLHDNCHATSRCRLQPSYETSKKVLTAKAAIDLLSTVITSSIIYKHPEDFVLGMDTGNIESFHNVMNIFHDKRIAFGSNQYLSRSHLSVCHWNENSGRDHTSVWHRSGAGKSNRKRSKKVYKDCTYNYCKDIWNNYLHSMSTCM
jgi:hypothetical protein